jgi:hypothetical protein
LIAFSIPAGEFLAICEASSIDFGIRSSKEKLH